MKAVMLSIQPKWIELIASGKKTVEVRKNKPKIEVPFKCYIYETKDKHFENIGVHYADDRKDFMHHIGKVIGCFVCDRIYNITPHFDKPDFCNQYLCDWKWGEGTACLSFTEINDYLKGEKGYGWHITDLVIYDKPKELSEFRSYNVSTYIDEEFGLPMPTHEIKRPFQSWGYVEELKGETE